MDWNEKGKKIKGLMSSKHSAKAISVFCRQLSILLDSGMMITEALSVIAKGQKKSFQKCILTMKEGIENGLELGKAAKKTGCFPPLFVEMMEMAEKTGGIAEILNALSAYYHRQDQLRSDVMQVTLYPLIVLILSVAIVVFLLTQVVPIFVDIITSLSGEVPFMTKVMIGLGEGLSKLWLFIIPLSIVFFIIRRNIKKESIFAEKWGRWLFRFPFLGNILSDHACMQFTQGLCLLIQGGVNLPESLHISKGIVGNTGMGMALKKIGEEVKKGRTLTECMEEAQIFPGELCQMIHVGEETGNLIQTLQKSAEYYLENFNRKTKLLTTLMEPLVMIIVGSMVLLVMLSMMQPIYQIYQGYVEMM